MFHQEPVAWAKSNSVGASLTSVGTDEPAVRQSPSIDEPIFRADQAIWTIRTALADQPENLRTFLAMLSDPGGLRKEPSLVIGLARTSPAALRAFLELVDRFPNGVPAHVAGVQLAPPSPPTTSGPERESERRPEPEPEPEPGPGPEPPLRGGLAPVRPELKLGAAQERGAGSLVRGIQRIRSIFGRQAATSPTPTYDPPERMRSVPEVYCELGHTLEALGAHDRAAAAFQEALRGDPTSWQLRAYHALALEGNGRWAEAVRAYLDAVRLDPNQSTDLLLRAFQALARLSSTHEASALGDYIQSQWRPTVISDSGAAPAGAAVLQFLGRVNLLRGDYTQAISDLEAARARQPEDWRTLHALGEAFWRDGQIQLAEQTLRLALDTARSAGQVEGQAASLVTLGDLFVGQSPAQAAEVLQQATRLQPRQASIEIRLGEAYLALHQWHQARTAADAAIALAPKDADAHGVRAAALCGLHQYADAVATADTALALDSNCLPALRAKAEALLDGPASVAEPPPYRQAIQLLTTYVRKRPSDTHAQQALVRALRLDGRPARQIVSTLKRAVRAAPDEARPELEVDLAEAALEEPSDSRSVVITKLLESAANRRPELKMSSRWWRLMGDARREEGDGPAAIACYRAALELRRDDVDVLERLATTLVDATQFQDAAEVWRQVVERSPDAGKPLVHLASAEYGAGLPAAALESVRQALALGVEGPLRGQAVQLQCRLVDELDRPVEELVEASTLHAEWQLQEDHPDEAIGLLRRARDLLRRNPELKPRHLIVSWYLADTLANKSITPLAPHVLREPLLESQQTWDEAAAVSPPTEADDWAHLTRARISELLARIPGFDTATEYWKAIVSVERAMLLRKEWALTANHWTALGRYYRLLALESNALVCTERALKIEPEFIAGQDERIAILADSGRLDEAEHLIQERGELSPNDWIASVKAFVLYQRQRYPEAIELLTALLAVDPGDIWSRTVRASAHRLAGDLDRARADLEAVWSFRDQEGYKSRDDRNLIGTAAYLLGLLATPTDRVLLEQAASIFSSLVDNSPFGASPLRDLGLCRVALGDLEHGERLLKQGVAQTINASDLDLFIKRELRFISQVAARWPNADQVLAVVERLEAATRQRAATLREPQSALVELQDRLDTVLADDHSAGWAPVALRAGMARLQIEQRQWSGALTHYAQLLESGRLPEARQAGLRRCYAGWRSLAEDLLAQHRVPEAVQTLEDLLHLARTLPARDELRQLEQRLGDVRITQRQFEAALGQYGRALALIDGATDHAEQAGLHGRAAYAAFRLGQSSVASEHVGQAFGLCAEGGESGAAERVAQTQRDLIADPIEFWALVDAYQAFLEQPGIDAGLRRSVEDTLCELFVYLDTFYGLGPLSAEETPPIVARLVLELGKALIPEDTSTQTWPLFTKYLPELRERVLQDTGITLPGVRVRPSTAYASGRYTILLDEVPLVEGKVEPNGTYCFTSADSLSRLDLHPGAFWEMPDPLTGAPGCWVSAQQTPALAALGVEAWNDPLMFVIRHLEAVLRRKLDEFLGIQEAEFLLESWNTTDRARMLIGKWLADDASRLRFARVVRSLAREGVPLTAWETLVETIGPHLDSAPITELVNEARLSVCHQLPGNDRPADQMLLGRELETRLAVCARANADLIQLGTPGAQWFDGVDELRARIRSRANPNLVLVTESPEVRAFLRRVLANVSPRFEVVARRELVGPPPVARLG